MVPKPMGQGTRQAYPCSAPAAWHLLLRQRTFRLPSGWPADPEGQTASPTAAGLLHPCIPFLKNARKELQREGHDCRHAVRLLRRLLLSGAWHQPVQQAARPPQVPSTPSCRRRFHCRSEGKGVDGKSRAGQVWMRKPVAGADAASNSWMVQNACWRDTRDGTSAGTSTGTSQERALTR